MEVRPTEIFDIKEILPKRHTDSRGFFSETYHKKALQEAGIDLEFVQDNHSLSLPKWTLRGLHFQIPPFAQDKLIRVTRGSVLDVAADLRKSSPTFGKHVSVILTAKKWNQCLIPIGFAHGFCTLEENTEVFYKVTNYYSPEHDRGILWNDPDLAIDWPMSEKEAILSEKDKKHPRFVELKEYF